MMIRFRSPARHLLGRRRLACIACTVLLSTLVPFKAHAVDIDFSFTGAGPGFNPSDNSWSWWAETVTGSITGLENNGTSAATDVIITSIPSGMTAHFPATPFDAFVSYVSVNSFTLSDGVVTSAELQVGSGYLDINVAGGYNSLAVVGQNEGNTLGFSGVHPPQRPSRLPSISSNPHPAPFWRPGWRSPGASAAAALRAELLDQ